MTLIRSNFYEVTRYGSMHICSISFFIIKNYNVEEMCVVIGDRWTEMMAFYSSRYPLHFGFSLSLSFYIILLSNGSGLQFLPAIIIIFAHGILHGQFV